MDEYNALYHYSKMRSECDIKSEIINNLERLYLLRCGFTAHPAKSKWWDFYEVYEDDIEEIKISVRKILILYLKYENINRKIELHPTSWSDWFREYCDIIYDAVWFHNIP